MTSTHHGILLHVVFDTKLRKSLIAVAGANALYLYLGFTLSDRKAKLPSLRDSRMVVPSFLGFASQAVNCHRIRD